MAIEEIEEMVIVSDDQSTIIKGFINSRGELEYDYYVEKDGGVIENPTSDIEGQLKEIMTESEDGEVYVLKDEKC